MNNPDQITVLGGGPAGLSVGYYAKKYGLDFTLFEAGDRVGGNCVTIRHGEFRFDSGAHRFHDKNPEVTKEIQLLLGEDLRRSTAPSHIYFEGKFIDFPLSPLNLIRRLGPFTFAKAGFEVIASRLSSAPWTGAFEDFALRTYGRTIASRFLLNYSEKLWGAKATQLSPYIAGTRMKGLNLKTFVTEAIKGRDAKVKHLDGAFYYPRLGIGMIADSLARFCGEEKILRKSRITRIFHQGNRIQAIEVNGTNLIEVDKIISTIPISLFLQIMDPSPSSEILNLAKHLRFRNLILVALFINRESFGRSATLYFPEQRFPFTRVYEPKVRSKEMSPPGKTSLVSEIPCQNEDIIWKSTDKELVDRVFTSLREVIGIKESEIIDTAVIRIRHAYPILELGFEDKIAEVLRYLSHFNNLKIAGRNGKFNYTSIHDMMGFGKEIIEEHIGSLQTAVSRHALV